MFWVSQVSIPRGVLKILGPLPTPRPFDLERPNLVR